MAAKVFTGYMKDGKYIDTTDRSGWDDEEDNSSRKSSSGSAGPFVRKSSGSSSKSSGSSSGNYRKALSAAQQARELATKQSVADLEAGRAQIEADAADAARQAYINRQLSLRDLPQRLSASGLSGGMTDSMALEIDTAYQKASSAALQEKNRALAELQRQIDRVKAQGEAALAELENEYRLMMARDSD